MGWEEECIFERKRFAICQFEKTDDESRDSYVGSITIYSTVLIVTMMTYLENTVIVILHKLGSEK